MDDTVIKVDNLSKKYILSHRQRESYAALRDVITRGVQNLGRKILSPFSGSQSSTTEEFFALKDVSFEIKRGDRVGIIGRNGAGKSTLLKLLSRITEPSNGRIEITGRVASLLEVGTGFHPELTGRENIYLNGAILGMARMEIKRKFDEIVAFAEIERFLDTPVKRYSSGMYVRLAFAVAANLEPEILLVDEVLAVGDAQFQKKCVGKMEEVSKNKGRTVLFVSHNMGIVAQLCEKTIVLEKGVLVFNNDTPLAIDFYSKRGSQNIKKIQREDLSDKTNQFISVKNVDEALKEAEAFDYDEEINLLVELNLSRWSQFLELAISLYDKDKKRIFTILEPLAKYYTGEKIMRFQITIPAKFIAPGRYSWLMCMPLPGIENYDLLDDICKFNVLETGSEFARYYGRDYGVVFARYKIKKLKLLG
ncbi:MAG: ABC transporter ATP-binding protein [Elusimicrobia bacterium]|nr:MAG: ABC transporter ATP-binding protein [Elusimicrobiota bacterium]KAF0157002.1 MAG: ABC transporter ATP-binding protein [Elusimicrobiota bacterium]